MSTTTATERLDEDQVAVTVFLLQARAEASEYESVCMCALLAQTLYEPMSFHLSRYVVYWDRWG